MNKPLIKNLIVFVLIGLMFLPSIANAFELPMGILWEVLKDTGKDLANGILAAVFSLIAGLVAGLPDAALSFLNWVAGPDFIKVSMTNSGLAPGAPAYNDLVGIGWDITRNLANVALIFGLVIIAINIIIGSQEVQAKKSLVNFILIAILINFTPVICGVIIDASNSLTTYFLQEGVPRGIVTFLQQEMSNNKNIDFAALIVFFFFGIFSAVIYLLYAVLFACRYIMLWILIILSPIAFATKVFPKSKYITKVFPSFFYWDEWWDQFIQWNVIGIPAGFFIYLSNVAMVKMAAKPYFADPSGISIFGQLFAYAMPFLFMAIGFFTTMSSGGAVGAKLSGTAKQIWSKTGAAAIGAGAGYAAGRAKAAGTYVKEGSIGYAGSMLHNLRAEEKDKVDWATKEGRDKGRQSYRDFKQGVKESAANLGIISRDASLSKSGSEKKAEELAKKMDLDYFNKNQGHLSSEERKAGDIRFMKDNVSDYLKGAGTAEEYQRRLMAINTYGDSSKEHKKIKVKALMDATYKNSDKANQAINGKTTNWGTLYGGVSGEMKIDEEMQKLSPKDLRDVASEDFLRNGKNLRKLSAGQLTYLRSNGSKTQVDAMEEAGELYKNDNPTDNKGQRIKDAQGKEIEGENMKKLREEREKLEKGLEAAKNNLELAKKSGNPDKIKEHENEVKNYKGELDGIQNLVRHFA